MSGVKRSLLRRTAIAGACAFALAATAQAPAEVAQKGQVRVSFTGSFSPTALPRQGTAPIAVTLGGKIGTTDGSQPPALRRLQIEINRVGRIDYRGLPGCAYEDIQPATTANALAACGAAKVGEGTFSASVAIPEQSPFPSRGKLTAFNGREKGKPVILAHVYGTEPVPTSFTLPLRISSQAKGSFGTVLSADLPAVTASIAFVTGISLKLDRRLGSDGGAPRGYLSAGCPAPKGFPGATFPLARTSFSFAGGPTVASTLQRSCKVRG